MKWVDQLQNLRSPELEAYFSLKKRFNNEHLVIARADKGETLVLLTRDQYELKMYDFLNSAGASLTAFSLTKHSMEVRAAIENTRLVFQPALQPQLIQMSYAIP